MWELAECPSSNVGRLEEFLERGFEPFAVTDGAWGSIIWLKKEKEVVKVHSKQGQSKSGGSRKTTPKSQAKDSS